MLGDRNESLLMKAMSSLSLVAPIENDPAAYELIKSLISLGHSLGFNMLAEGIETRQQFKMLLNAGCNKLQGYFLSEPLETENVLRFIMRTHYGTASEVKGLPPQEDTANTE